MPTDMEISRTLEQAIPLFEGTFQKAAKKHLFNGCYTRMDAGTGYKILGDIYPIGEMKKFKGEAEVNGFEAVSVRTETELYTYTMGIDYNLMRKINNIFDNRFTAAIAKSVSRALGHEEKLLTNMLDANTRGHLSGTSNFFSATNPIPGSNRTFSNTQVKPLTTAAEVRTAVASAQGMLIKQLNVAGVRMHEDAENTRFIVHYHPDKFEIFRDAFLPGNLNGLGSGVLLNDKAPLPNVSRRANPFIADPGTMYMFIENGGEEGESYPALALFEEEPTNMITTIGIPGHLLKILFNGELAQVRHAYNVGYGSPFAVVRTTAS